MKQTYNSIYVKEYYEGYSMGINPFSSSNLDNASQDVEE
jgi:hypothetical protein